MINQMNELAQLIAIEYAFIIAIAVVLLKIFVELGGVRIEKTTFNTYSMLNILSKIGYYVIYTINLTILMVGFYSMPFVKTKGIEILIIYTILVVGKFIIDKVRIKYFKA